VGASAAYMPPLRRDQPFGPVVAPVPPNAGDSFYNAVCTLPSTALQPERGADGSTAVMLPPPRELQRARAGHHINRSGAEAHAFAGVGTATSDAARRRRGIATFLRSVAVILSEDAAQQ
jgi:hypothetical protein